MEDLVLAQALVVMDRTENAMRKRNVVAFHLRNPTNGTNVNCNVLLVRHIWKNQYRK